MKSIITKKAFYSNLALLLLIFSLFLLPSCGKKDTPTPNTTGHTVKFTITVTGSVPVGDAGLINLAFGAMDPANAQNSTLWKVNSVTRANETIIGFDGSNFPQGKTTTIVVESVVSLSDISAGLTFGAIPNLPSYTISFKAEIDGKVKTDDENVSITSQNQYDHDYSY